MKHLSAKDKNGVRNFRSVSGSCKSSYQSERKGDYVRFSKQAERRLTAEYPCSFLLDSPPFLF